MNRRAVILLVSLVALAGACESDADPSPDAGPDASPDAGTDGAPSQLRAAARAVEVTPEPGAVIVGYGSRVSTDVRDPLFANVLVLREGTDAAALVTLDLPGIAEWHASLIRGRVGVAIDAPIERVIVTATHTHSAPMLDDDAWSRALIDRVAEAAREAARSLEPARIARADGAISFDVNRRLVVDGTAVARPNPEGARDGRVRSLRLARGDGTTIAVLTHAVCHPNVLLGVASTRISADFVGEARRTIEARFEAPWLFVNGSAGDVRPLVVDAGGAFRLGTDADLEAIGGELARAVIDPLETSEARPVTDALAVARTAIEAPRRDGTALGIELVALRIDQTRLLTIPGEPFVNIGLAIESRLEGDVLVLGYANGYADYIVTLEAEPFGGYEVERSILRPEASVAIEDALVELADRVR